MARAREERTTITALVTGWLTEYGRSAEPVLPPAIEAVVGEDRRHPERGKPRPVRRNPAASAPEPVTAPRRCPHPGKRSVGGWCPGCDHLILTGGAWA